MKNPHMLCAEYKAKGAECWCNNIRMAARTITHWYDQALRPIDLRATQFSVLWAVLALQPVTQKALARAIALDSTTLTRSLRLLEERRLIRVFAGTDRREKKIQLTYAGQAALAQGFPLWEKVQSNINAKIDSTSKTNLTGQLFKLTGTSC